MELYHNCIYILFIDVHTAVREMTIETNKSEQFLLINDQDNGILIYSSHTNLECMCNDMSELFIDGTFKCSVQDENDSNLFCKQEIHSSKHCALLVQSQYELIMELEGTVFDTVTIHFSMSLNSQLFLQFNGHVGVLC
jgi:hypothetical protein